MTSMGKHLPRALAWLGTLGFALAALQGILLAATVAFGGARAPHPENRPQFVGVREAFWYHPPGEFDDLYGSAVLSEVPGQHVGCIAAWTDDDPIFARARKRGGPRNGVEIIYWKSVTYRGKTAVGKYLADLSSWSSAGTGAPGFPSGGSSVANQRLIERLVTPAPSTPGYRTIMPGECVGSPLDADGDGVVGRFMIDLPPGRAVRVGLDLPTGVDVGLQVRVRFRGGDVPNEYEVVGPHYAPEHGPGALFNSAQGGRHEILVERAGELRKSPSTQGGGNIYTLQASWGQDLGRACNPDRVTAWQCF